ncbi:MAG: 3D domain-containing protein [Eubacterium sp.]|nr:3D domain-containing protein [Eubacterium sp.]
MKFDKDFDISDIKAVRSVKSFAEKHDVKRVVRKCSKKLQSVAVISALGIICFSSVTAAKTNDVPSDGRMLSISDIRAEASTENITDRISYDEMVAQRFESDQYAKIEVSEKNYEAVLLAKDNDEKNKIALQKLKAEKEEEARKEQEAKAKADAEAKARAEAEERAKQQTEVEKDDSKAEVKAEDTTTETVAVESDEPSGTYLGEFVATAYCACVYCCGKTDGITASGTQCTAGRTIAADTSIFPFGTELVIDGHTYVVEDVGGAIGGHRIDIYFDSHQEALNYGRRTVQVYSK